MYKYKYLKYKTKYRLLKGGTEISISTKKALFPTLSDEEKFNLLKIDIPSITYISYQRNADLITNLIIKNMKSINLTPSESIITDATGGVGGNTLSFAPKFKLVNAIEIDKTRSEYLKNNVDVYNYTNVNVINGDSVEEIKKIKNHDIIIIDPPWGGSDYKKFKTLRLKMSETELENLCLDIFNPTKMAKVPKMIALKLPLNYDVKYLYYKLHKYKIKKYILKKMLILIITNQPRNSPNTHERAEN